MTVIIFEITATIPDPCIDGRSPAGIWGYEKQFHATRESAEAAAARLRAGGYWGCSGTPVYEIREQIREHFGDDSLSEAEWRRACRQAGIDPVTGALAVLA